MLLEEMIQKYETVERNNCKDCGNLWWFSMPDGYVCTCCAKTHGRSTGDPYKEKSPHTSSTEKEKL